MSHIIIPDPIIFKSPLRVWLGMILAVLVLLQMGIGKGIIKLNFNLWHRKIIPILIILILLLHFWYGFQIYFLK